jgi:hypothetical protein
LTSDIKETRYTALPGQRKSPYGEREQFFLDLKDKDVEKIAPVIFVRRRL